jgi:carbamate kinase
MTADEAENYVKAGQFGEGSMKPKVEAGIRFIRAGGRRTIITALNKALEALEGRVGTMIVP